MSTAQSRASNKLYPFVPKGRKAEIQAAADSLGESLNDFIVKAIDDRIDRIQKEGAANKKTGDGTSKI